MRSSVAESLHIRKVSNEICWAFAPSPCSRQTPLSRWRAVSPGCAVQRSRCRRQESPGDEAEGDTPPGTVYIGVFVDGAVGSKVHRFDGSPEQVCDRARRQALLDLIDALSDAP